MKNIFLFQAEKHFLPYNSFGIFTAGIFTHFYEPRNVFIFFGRDCSAKKLWTDNICVVLKHWKIWKRIKISQTFASSLSSSVTFVTLWRAKAAAFPSGNDVTFTFSRYPKAFSLTWRKKGKAIKVSLWSLSKCFRKLNLFRDLRECMKDF